MDSAKLNDWMQVVGIFAVVASLVFVGLQMKQSQEIAIAAQYSERAALVMEYWVSQQQDDFAMRRMGEAELARHGLLSGMPDDSTPEEIGSTIISIRKAIAIYDNQHFQYTSGFLTEEAWAVYRIIVQRRCLMPRFRHFVEHHSARASFKALCDQESLELSQNVE